MVRMTNRLGAGGLAIPPPLLSRTYQVLSDGTAAAMQGRKVAHVEFPFALRHVAVLIAVFLALAPICIAAFVDSYEVRRRRPARRPLHARRAAQRQHAPLDPSGGDATPRARRARSSSPLCFFTSIGYVSLNETARELEMPFGLDANDLNLTEYQRDFNHKLAQLLDQTVRRPRAARSHLVAAPSRAPADARSLGPAVRVTLTGGVTLGSISILSPRAIGTGAGIRGWGRQLAG